MSSRKHITTTRNVPSFSSRSLGSYAGSERTIPRLGNSYFGFGNQPAYGSLLNTVVVDRILLEPQQFRLDPSIHAIKVQEKEQIKTLNDRFASFIDKVRHCLNSLCQYFKNCDKNRKKFITSWSLLCFLLDSPSLRVHRLLLTVLKKHTHKKRMLLLDCLP